MFHSTITALVTPLLQNKIDYHSLDRLIDYQFVNSIKNIIIAGSTGEGILLDIDEYHDLLKAAVNSNSQVGVIAGCSAASIEQAIDRAIIAEKLGAKGILITLPCYVKPSQEGIYKYFESIHDATQIPLILYSVPSRTGVDFTDDTICKLSELERIVAFKDASNDLERPLRLCNKATLTFFAGNDTTALAFNAQGGQGVVSVASNLFPKEIGQIQELWFANKPFEAMKMNALMSDFYQALLLDTNPIAIKYALYLKGLCSFETRPPLSTLSVIKQATIQNVVAEITGLN